MIFYNSPLKIEFDDDGLKVEGKKHKFSTRMLSDINETLMDKLEIKEDKPIYIMYREVYKKSDLRFDITVIASRILGKEYARTYGHYHPIAEGKLSYPEIYQVLFGDARFILQRPNSDHTTDVIVVSAKDGDVVLIPPNYGHVTINVSKEKPLFLSNLVADVFESDYSEYKKNNGQVIYYTADDLVQHTNYVVKNSNRVTASELNKKYNFECKDLLNELYYNERKFDFLMKPSLLFKH